MAFWAKPAIGILAGLAVVDLDAVTHVQAIGSTEPPDRVLNEPRKISREGRIKMSRVNATRNPPDNLGTTSWPIAGNAILMGLAAVM